MNIPTSKPRSPRLSRVLTPLKTTAALMGAGLAAASAQAVVPFEYSHSFAHAGDPVALTTEAQDGVADYFHVASASGSWVLSRGSTYNSIWKTLYGKVGGGGRTFVQRSLHDGGALASDLALDTFSVSVDSRYYWGANADGTLSSYVGLLNAEGKGYAATFQRNGNLVISQITGGLSGTWTTLVQGDTYNLDAGNTYGYQKATFSFTGSGLTLSTVDGAGAELGSVSVALSSLEVDALSGFTTVFLGSRQGGNEENYFGTLTLSGTATAVPEPASAAFLLGLGMLGVAAGTRSRFMRNRR